MDKFKETIIYLDSDNITLDQLVSILVLIVSKININTISGMARSEGKTPRGIDTSSRYRKLMVGCQKMAISGASNNSMPF